MRVGKVDRVARAGVVDVKAGLTADQPIVGGVVEAAITQCGAAVVAFRGMIVNHIQNDLDAGSMKPPHHVAETDHSLRAEIARLGGEKADGVVPPIIAQAFFQKKAIIDEAVHRQEFNGRDAELLEVFQHRFAGQCFVGAAHFSCNIGVFHRQALGMGLIDKRVGPVSVGAWFNVRKQFRVRDDALWDEGRAVTAVERQVL